MGGSRSYLLLALNDRDRTIAGWQSGEGTDWVDQMLLGGMLKCAKNGYRMIFELVDTHSSNVERELTSALGAIHPDGVILTPPHSRQSAITEPARPTTHSVRAYRIEGRGFRLRHRHGRWRGSRNRNASI